MKKYYIMEFRKSGRRLAEKLWTEHESITKTMEEKDHGITFTDGVPPQIHRHRIIRDPYNLLRKVRMAFT